MDVAISGMNLSWGPCTPAVQWLFGTAACLGQRPLHGASVQLYLLFVACVCCSCDSNCQCLGQHNAEGEESVMFCS